MTIGVFLKGAFEDGTSAVVPIDTAWTKPDIASVRESCSKELRSLFPMSKLSSEYEVLDQDIVLAKIKAANEQPYRNC